MSFRRVTPTQWCVLIICALFAAETRADEPKPTPENTIHKQLAEAVNPQTFSRRLKFFVVERVDRSNSPQRVMDFKHRAEIFLAHTPFSLIPTRLEPFPNS